MVSSNFPRRSAVSSIKPYVYSYQDVMKSDSDYPDNAIVKMYFGKVCDGSISESDFLDRLAELWGANSNFSIVQVAAVGDRTKTSYVMDAPVTAMIKIPGNWPEKDAPSSLSGAPMGLGASDCSIAIRANPITKVKNYVYIVQSIDLVAPSGIGTKFGVSKWAEILNANSEKSFKTVTGGGVSYCWFDGIKAGDELKVPYGWPGSVDAPPNKSIKYKTITPPAPIVTTCGDGYHFDKSGVCIQDDCKAGYHWDSNKGVCLADNSITACQSGYMYNPDTQKCEVISGVDPVVDEPPTPKAGTKPFPWEWALLGGVVFLGGLVAIVAIKKKSEDQSNLSDPTPEEKLNLAVSGY